MGIKPTLYGYCEDGKRYQIPSAWHLGKEQLMLAVTKFKSQFTHETLITSSHLHRNLSVLPPLTALIVVNFSYFDALFFPDRLQSEPGHRSHALCQHKRLQEPDKEQKIDWCQKSREEWGLWPTRGHTYLWPIIVMWEYGPSIARSQPFHKKPDS